MAKSFTEEDYKRVDNIVEQMTIATSLVSEIMQKSEKLDTYIFYAMIAMAIKEKCKQDGESVIERMETLLKASKEVVATCGTY